jgi:hypothetical protein
MIPDDITGVFYSQLLRNFEGSIRILLVQYILMVLYKGFVYEVKSATLQSLQRRYLSGGIHQSLSTNVEI